MKTKRITTLSQRFLLGRRAVDLGPGLEGFSFLQYFFGRFFAGVLFYMHVAALFFVRTLFHGLLFLAEVSASLYQIMALLRFGLLSLGLFFGFDFFLVLDLFV